MLWIKLGSVILNGRLFESVTSASEAQLFASSAVQSPRSGGVYRREEGRMVGNELVSKRHKS